MVTNTTIQQTYIVADLEAATALYDSLRWYRSSARDGGYEAATAAAAAPAELRGIPITAALNGKVLRLRLNGLTELSHTFEGADPIQPAEAAEELDELEGITVEAEGDELVIRTEATGSGASLEVLEDSDAAPYLGLIVGSSAVGLDADSTLHDSQLYTFSDQNSDPEFWYCVELRNSTTGKAAPKSAPFQSRSSSGAPLSRYMGCYLRLVDVEGKPLPCRAVTIHNTAVPNRVVSGSTIFGSFRNYASKTTDQNGYAEFWLARGSTVDLVIHGSGFVRRITLPANQDVVDLLDPDLVHEDEFGIQEPNIDFAIRTS